jgi:cytochrome oxidase Cu insertion factor (SCO1/SenC/PrrC family)
MGALACLLFVANGAHAATTVDVQLPDVALIDAHGKPFNPASLVGKVVLVDFIHTSCPSMCVMLTSKLARLAKKLGPEMGSKVAILSVSNDPSNDKPADLLAMARQHGADKSGWVFATGSPDNVSRVLKAFGLSLKRETDGEAEHIMKVFVVAPDGREAVSFWGPVVSDRKLLAEVKRMAARAKALPEPKATRDAEEHASRD